MAERICTLPDCERPHVARGWCSMHYQRWKSQGDPLAGARERHYCTIAGCAAPVIGRGWCERHYRRWQKHGDPFVTSRIVGDDVVRFEQYLRLGDIPEHTPHLGACWVWTGGLDPDGYGKFRSAGDQFAHRFSYTLHIRPIPDDLELDHLCRVRCCVNPWHLEAVTRVVNILRAAEVRYADYPADADRIRATAS